MLKKKYYLALLLCISFTMVNCQKETGTSPNTEDQTKQWTRMADVSGSAFRGSASFSIGNIGYFVSGMSGGGLISSVWAYNSETNTWAQKANYPGTAVADAEGFSVGQKGYVFGGTDNNAPLSDLWEYNSTNDTWTKITGFPGDARYGASSFVFGTKVYLFSGSTNPGVWEYDTLTKVWTKKADFPGQARELAVSFVIGNKGYLGTGGMKGASAYTSLKDFWEFDPAANTWTRKNDFPGEARGYAKGFAVGSKGYLGLGITRIVSGVLTMVKDFWEYNPQNDQWTKKNDFEGLARGMAAGFVIGTNIYIGIGNTASFADLKDCWKFDTTK